MQQKRKTFILRMLITALIYSALLLPFQISLPLFAGTDIRPSAFIPIVFGIFWGTPAAIGVFFGNLCCDLYCFDTPLVLLGSLLNALSALCARRLFYSTGKHPLTSGEYVYSFGSLMNFLLSSAVIELALSTGIGISVHYFSGAPVNQAVTIIFLNNMHSIVILGIPAMLFLPTVNRWADEPKGNGKKRHVLTAPLFLLSSLILAIPFTVCEPDPLWTLILIIPLIGAIIATSPTTPVAKDPALFGFQSIRYTTFRKLMLIAIVTSIAVSLLFFSFSGKQNEDFATSFTRMYHMCAYLDILFLFLFAFSNHVVEKQLLSPIRSLAAKLSLDGEQYDNELDILSKRLDFIVSGNSSLLSSDEHSIIVGLSTKDYANRFSVEEAHGIISGICLKHVGGYISTKEAEGGYNGSVSSGTEQILIYTIYGASDEQIRAISDDVITALDQESVIIEKNRLTRYYYYGS